MARKPATKALKAPKKTAKRAAPAKQTLGPKDLDHPLIRSLAALSVSNAEELKKITAIASDVARLFEWAREISANMSRLELQIKRDARKHETEVAASVGPTSTYSRQFPLGAQ